MSGPMTSSRVGPTMAGDPACSTSSTSSPGMPCGNPHRSQAQLDRRHRRPVGPVHPAWLCPAMSVPDNGRSSSPGCTGGIVAVGAKTAFIEPRSPETATASFNSKLRDELLGRDLLARHEAKIIIKAWRRYYTTPRATLVAWIQATGTRGHHLACASKRTIVICPGTAPRPIMN